MYCQKVIGDINFSIEEWNEQFALCNKLGIDCPTNGGGEECKEQCFECAAIVGERRLKTQKLIEKQKEARNK